MDKNRIVFEVSSRDFVRLKTEAVERGLTLRQLMQELIDTHFAAVDAERAKVDFLCEP